MLKFIQIVNPYQHTAFSPCPFYHRLGIAAFAEEVEILFFIFGNALAVDYLTPDEVPYSFSAPASRSASRV